MSPADPPPLFVITGAMAAGKSTVAQALAERFDRSAHVRGDTFRRSVVRGREDMGAQPSEEAFAQLRLRYRIAVDAAEAYAAAGFVSVLQDVILGPLLTEVVDSIAHRPLALIVLDPSAEILAIRDERRAKTGYLGFEPDELRSALHEDTPRLGLWLDTSSQTVDETVDSILDRWNPEACLP